MHAYTYPKAFLYPLEATIVAFAVHLLLGTVEIDQSQMRQHLLKCLKNRKFSSFPTKKKCGYRSRHLPFREIELSCTV